MFRPMTTAHDTCSTVPDSRQTLVDAIEAHIAREEMTRTGFGMAALEDASFLGRLERGSGVRLRTADKVLAFLGGEPVGPRFRSEVDAFLAVTRTKPHLFGEQAMGDPTFVLRLERGRSVTLATVDRVRAFMAENATAAEREAIRAAVEDGAPAVPVEREEQEETGMTEDGYMNTEEAAAYLKLSPRTLERYRGTGKGPLFHRFGNRARYLRSRVVAWAKEREARSTTEADEKDREESAAASPPDNDDTGRRDP